MTARRRALPATLVVGGGLLTALVVLAVAAPPIWGSTASTLTADIRQRHSATHLLGTDALGRDVLARTLVATRLTLQMSALAMLISVCLGIALGAGTVVLGPRSRFVGARGIDLLVSFPPIIIALAITAIFSPSKTSAAFAIGVGFCAQFARLINTMASSINTRDFVIGARLLGVGRVRVLIRHMLPNILGPVFVLASVGFATSIVALSGLSYLGLGVQQPAYDWGALLSNGLRDLYVNPAEAFGPAVAILVTGVSAGLLGDGLARYLDPKRAPRQPRRHRKPPRPAMSASASGAASGSGPASGSAASASASGSGAAPSGPASGSGSASAHDAQPAGGPESIVSVRGLTIASPDHHGSAALVRGVCLDIAPGEIVGLVGESGSGKSLTAAAIARLLPPTLTWTAQRLDVCGMDASSGRAPTRLATEVGIVFQDPSSSFNPALRIGTQVSEVLRVHRKVDRKTARRRAIDALREVHVSAPQARLTQYPHELSGGMRQRAMIAMALLSEPRLLIADEPTTALDVTVQADVLRLLARINRERNTAILLISHDISVVSALCQRVCVMYAGRIVEEISVEELRAGRARHPYTEALLAATPRADSHRFTNPLRPLPGRPPTPGDLGDGCAFAGRCPLVMDICRVREPHLLSTDRGSVACHAVNREPATSGAAR